MQELDDIALLREYAERDSEEAFATLVRRHINKVYSVALRQTGQPHQAEEITQAVFVILAGKSRRLGAGVILSGWLYQTARLTALTFVRSDIRRARREQEAHMQTISNNQESEIWTQIAPLLDAAVSGLNETDRLAVVLRFFDGKSMKEIAAALGANEDAAKKRVNRAVEKLRIFFLKRGITSTTATLMGAISAHSVQAAPAALAESAIALAMAEGGVAGGSTLTLIKGALKVMAWTKAKTALVAAVVAASVVLPLLLERQAQARMRDGAGALRQQAAEWSRLQAENERLSKAAANTSLVKSQMDDLQKLRQELGPLRQKADQVAQLREENRQLKAKMGEDNPKTPLQLKEEAIAKMSFGKNWIIGFYQYAEKHNGQFPASFEDAASFVPDKVKNQADVTTDQFDIVFQGSPSALEKPQDVIVLRETQSWETAATDDRKGKRAKTYGFADGHFEIHQEPENDFGAYEQQHMIPTPAGSP